MILDEKHKKLRRDPTQIVVQDHMNLNTLVRMKGYKGVPLNERPPHKNLFGHLINPGYVDPGKNEVRHANSDSDEDNPLCPVNPDAKRKRQVVNVGAKIGKGKEKQDDTEPAQKKVSRRKKSVAKKGLHLVDEVSVDFEETQEDERRDSENETVKSTTPKATVAGESESLNKSVEEQRTKSPIALDETDEGLGLGSEDFVGSPKSGEKQKRPQYKKKEKVLKPMEKRARDIEVLVAGKKLPPASSSKSPITSSAAKKQKTSSA